MNLGDETDNLYEHLSLLFQTCISTNIIPAEWKSSYPSANFEKCSYYRGIMITGSMSPIYG